MHKSLSKPKLPDIFNHVMKVKVTHFGVRTSISKKRKTYKMYKDVRFSLVVDGVGARRRFRNRMCSRVTHNDLPRCHPSSMTSLAGCCKFLIIYKCRSSSVTWSNIERSIDFTWHFITTTLCFVVNVGPGSVRHDTVESSRFKLEQAYPHWVVTTSGSQSAWSKHLIMLLLLRTMFASW